MGDGCQRENCYAHLEWHCEHAGLARVFGGDQSFGDPYCYCLPYVVRERFRHPAVDGVLGFVEFIGVLKVMKPCQYRAMRQAVRQAGWRILSTRSKDGAMRTIEVCKCRKGELDG
jgi:hypothetical protein